MSYLEQYMDRMATVPNDVNRCLRLIRTLDKRVETIHQSLIQQQKKFELKMKEIKQKKISEVPAELKAQYGLIVEKQKEMYGYAKEKQDIAGQLTEAVMEHYEQIRTQLRKKIKQRPPEDQTQSITKKKKKTVQNMKLPTKQEQFLYDANDVKYCYCNRGSFGEMVGCENIYCEKEWFHVECLSEKNRPGEGEWFCNDCMKMRDRYKKSNLKEFI